MRKEKQLLNQAEILPTSKKETEKLQQVSVMENLWPLCTCAFCKLEDASSAWPQAHHSLSLVPQTHPAGAVIW